MLTEARWIRDKPVVSTAEGRISTLAWRGSQCSLAEVEVAAAVVEVRDAEQTRNMIAGKDDCGVHFGSLLEE
jgi:hypothetical protein